MADLDPRDLAQELAKALGPALVEAVKPANADPSVVIAGAMRDILHSQRDIDALKKKVYDEHNPVYLWAKGVMDSYRKVMIALFIAGVVSLTGIVMQIIILLKTKGGG